MRITNTMMINNYQKTLEDNYEQLSDNYNQLNSQRKFTKASEDPASALKALKARHSLTDITQYSSNLSDMTSLNNATETEEQQLNSIVKTAQESIQAAVNGTKNGTDYNNYAESLNNMQQQVVQTLNSTFNGRYVFGGSQDGPAPFKIGGSSDGVNNGKLMYYDYNNKMGNTSAQYVPLSSVTSANIDSMKLTAPVDVGLGMKMDASGKLVSGTYYDAATSALDMITVSSNGSDNLVDMLGSAINKLKSGTNELGDELNMAGNLHDSILKGMVNTGEKSKLLTFLSDKTTDETTNVTESLSKAEDIDASSAITSFLMRQAVYNASLSIGTKIIQPSLIDFLK